MSESWKEIAQRLNGNTCRWSANDRQERITDQQARISENLTCIGCGDQWKYGVTCSMSRRVNIDDHLLEVLKAGFFIRAFGLD